jgi:ABC-type nickel/cobalt efflux system permease component RcnA
MQTAEDANAGATLSLRIMGAAILVALATVLVVLDPAPPLGLVAGLLLLGLAVYICWYTVRERIRARAPPSYDKIEAGPRQ